MVQRLTERQKSQLFDLMHIVMQQTLDGARPFSEVKRALEDITDGKFDHLVVKTPVRYASTDAQIKKSLAFLDEYGGGREGFRPSDIPPVPNFTPRDNTDEVLLLAIYLPSKGREPGFRRTFEAWWESVDSPTGLVKIRDEELLTDVLHMRLMRGVAYKPGIRWVAFDPSAFKGRSPKYALVQSGIDGTTLAHAEVLMAAAMFPEWLIGMNGFPIMAALQYCWNARWSRAPTISLLSDDHQLRLHAYTVANADPGSSSPTVRVC